MTLANDRLQQFQDADTDNSTQSGGGERTNLGSPERIASLVGGGVLTLLGLRRMSLGGLLVAGAGAMLMHRGYSGFCPLYKMLGVDQSSGAARPEEYFEHGIQVCETYTIDRSPEELFNFWRNFENLPRFMTHLKSVKCDGPNRSHWIAKGPAGASVEWDAEIINEEPNALIAWRSLENATVHNAGSVRFLPSGNGRGTEVRVVIDYIPPAGRMGNSLARFFGADLKQIVHNDLRQFKQLMETGEIPTTAGQPRGQCS
jgi:uncharacterized membrane protein